MLLRICYRIVCYFGDLCLNSLELKFAGIGYITKVFTDIYRRRNRGKGGGLLVPHFFAELPFLLLVKIFYKSNPLPTFNLLPTPLSFNYKWLIQKSILFTLFSLRTSPFRMVVITKLVWIRRRRELFYR